MASPLLSRLFNSKPNNPAVKSRGKSNAGAGVGRSTAKQRISGNSAVKSVSGAMATGRVSKGTQRTASAKPKPVERDDDGFDNVVEKEKVVFDYKQPAGGEYGDNTTGTSVYKRTGTEEYVNADSNLVTKFNLKAKKKK